MEEALSYQLAFWKSSRRQDPAKVYAKVVDGRSVRGLDPVNAAEVELRLKAAFHGWSIDSSLATTASQTAFSSDGAALDVFYGPQGVVCTCYGMAADDLNRVIDVFQSLGMPLYDPQTGERFR